MKAKILLLFFCLLIFTLTVFAQSKEAVKIDEFESVSCDDYLARMDNVFITQKNNQNSKIYVFIYEGKIKQDVQDKNYNTIGYKEVLPAYGEVNARISTMKKRISLSNSLENFVFVKGGFRKIYSTEFWLIPNGAIPPKPTPTLPKLNYRKGKARGFCWSM
jgi:hypothetical protein